MKDPLKPCKEQYFYESTLPPFRTNKPFSQLKTMVKQRQTYKSESNIDSTIPIDVEEVSP
jgi:hypothetical protein